jgi:hypothetical protein
MKGWYQKAREGLLSLTMIGQLWSCGVMLSMTLKVWRCHWLPWQHPVSLPVMPSLCSQGQETQLFLIVSSIFVKEELEVERIIQSFVQILKFWYNYCVILTEFLYGLEGSGYWSKEGQQCCYLHQSHWSKTILLCSRQQCHQTLA